MSGSIFFDPTAFEDDAAEQAVDREGEFEGENDEGDHEEASLPTKKKTTNEAILIVVEVTESLFIEHEMIDRSRPHLTASEQPTIKGTMWQDLMLSIADIMKNKIIASENDKMGVILFGTTVAENDQRFDGIVTLLNLDFPDASRIHLIEVEAEKSRNAFIGRYGGIQIQDATEGPSLANLLWMCSQIFHTQNRTKQYRSTVMLYTAVDNPSRQRDMAIQRLKDLQQDCATVKLFPLEPQGTQFDITKFYADVIELPEGADMDSFVENSKLCFEDLRQRIRNREHKQRLLTTLPFTLFEGIEFSVGVYTSVMETKPKLPIYLRASDNQLLKSETKWICDETAALLSQDEIKTYVTYGKSRVFLSKEDRQQIYRTSEGVGLRLLGYKARKSLKRHHNIKHSYFLHPMDSIVEGSSHIAAALISCMARRDQVAVVKWTQRLTSPARLVAIVPQMELIDEDNTQVQPAGFHMIPLPFMEDVRHLNLPPSPSVETNQVTLAENVIRALQLEDFHPSQVDNPSLQKHYCSLEALALGYTTMPEISDDLVPDEEAVKLRKDVVENWKVSVYGAGVDIPKAPSSSAKRKASSPTARTANKVQKVSVDVETLVKGAWGDGSLTKLTVVQLKEWLSSHKLPVGGKKADLIERVEKELKND